MPLVKVVSVIWAILRGLLWALADEFPLGGRERPTEKKESPWWERPETDAPAGGAAKQPGREAADRPEATAPAADRASAPSWWPEAAPPTTPPTIKVETDAGSFIARATFSGHHALGVQRVERPRAEGESRRRRRTSTPAAAPEIQGVAVEPREPVVPGEAVPATSADVVAELREPAVPTEPEPAKAEAAAAVIDPTEAPRVAQAHRVRCRFRPGDQSGENLLATTLATRLALAASASAPPPPSGARMGDSV